MKNPQPSSYTTDPESEEVRKLLETVVNKLDSEIISKQNTIEHLQQEIKSMHSVIDEKNNLLKEISKKLTECENFADGNRQLINKLLSEIKELNLDIEWYKKTYEKRSLLGTIKEKLFRKH